jgi:predicted nuclease of predicted toxin-antitoxin system
MKFLFNAQLPRRLVKRLVENGHDAIHTLDLPDENRTSDEYIIATSIREQRTLVTKDGDFVAAYTTRQGPYRLLLVSTGNISNAELEKLLV